MYGRVNVCKFAEPVEARRELATREAFALAIHEYQGWGAFVVRWPRRAIKGGAASYDTGPSVVDEPPLTL